MQYTIWKAKHNASLIWLAAQGIGILTLTPGRYRLPPFLPIVDLVKRSDGSLGVGCISFAPFILYMATRPEDVPTVDALILQAGKLDTGLQGFAMVLSRCGTLKALRVVPLNANDTNPLCVESQPIDWKALFEKEGD